MWLFCVRVRRRFGFDHPTLEGRMGLPSYLQGSLNEVKATTWMGGVNPVRDAIYSLGEEELLIKARNDVKNKILKIKYSNFNFFDYSNFFYNFEDDVFTDNIHIKQQYREVIAESISDKVRELL